MIDLNELKLYHWNVYNENGKVVATYGFEIYAKDFCNHPEHKKYNLRYERGKARAI